MSATTSSQQRASNLRVRGRDSKQRPQMAEGMAPTGPATANDDFFIVHHYSPPEVDEASWSLHIADATRQQTLRVADLRKLPQHTVTAMVECAGMSRGYLSEPRVGTQFGHGMVGLAKWGGPRVRDVLELAGLSADFTTLIVRGGDEGVTMPENEHSDFSKGLPRSKALDDDTILALTMNNEPLPYLHGGPVRMVVPGWYGVWWVKWPRTIETSRDPNYDGFWQHRRYTFQTLEGAQLGVVRDQLPRSVIVSPVEKDIVTKGAIEVSGLAWAGEQNVAKVEVSIDRGKTWTDAQVGQSSGKWTWIPWRATVDFNGPTGLHSIAARATDTAGRTQEWTSKDNKFGYGNNKIVSVNVDVVT